MEWKWKTRPLILAWGVKIAIVRHIWVRVFGRFILTLSQRVQGLRLKHPYPATTREIQAQVANGTPLEAGEMRYMCGERSGMNVSKVVWGRVAPPRSEGRECMNVIRFWPQV